LALAAEKTMSVIPQTGEATDKMPPGTRVFLFLQSHPSFFGREVVRHMRGKGQTCHVVNLYLGDWWFRLGTGAVNYTGSLADWPDWLETFIDRHRITDIVYYADQRPYHRIARKIARARGIDCTAYEFGYLRPDYITLERGGMGPFSHFPDDPDQIERLASDLPDRMPDGYYPYGFSDEAVNEVSYHLIPWFLPFLFPRYRRDRLYTPLTEYISYIPKLLLKRRRMREADRVVEARCADNAPFFTVIMQMQGDYQVRRAAAYPHLNDMVNEVLASFAEHAPEDARLVFKMHPLENAVERRPRNIRRAAVDHGLAERVDVIDGGNLTRLYNRTSGIVLLNSTAGLTGILQGIPVKTLGIAIYDMPRLTHQGPLDSFWTAPQRPDPNTAAAFRKLLTTSIQVKGNFFTPAGRAAAVPEFARRLIEGDINSHGAFVEPPPRLAKARAMSVPMTYED
jgi:capsular polysaccharide export protein